MYACWHNTYEKENIAELQNVCTAFVVLWYVFFEYIVKLIHQYWVIELHIDPTDPSVA